MLNLATLALAALAAHSTQARPSGAPLCVIDDGKISANHGPASNLNFAVEAKVNGGLVDIKLTGPSNFKGILMYAVASDPKVHLGAFQDYDTGLFKPQTEVCASENIGGGPESTLTHVNANDKPTATTMFSWKPLANDPTTGLKLELVVNNGLRAWQKLSFDMPSGIVAGNSSAAGNSTARPGTNATTTPPKKSDAFQVRSTGVLAVLGALLTLF